MQTKYKRHQKVKLLLDANPEYVEYDPELDEEKPPITKGMTGRINVLLPNGQYHVEIIDEKTNRTIAYALMDEEYLEAVD